MPDEIVTIVITGQSAEAVAAAERTSAAVGGIGLAAKKSAAETVASSARVKSAGAGMSAAGRTMTRNLTLPIVAAGVASVKMSADFHRSMRMVSTQAGGTSREVSKLSDQVLELAQHTSDFSPKELADALFHIESVGMRGAKAMNTLRAASQLADVGNSDLESTTYALVSAMETGIKGTHDLHDAIGTLNAIVGTGDMRMEDLTEALSSGVLVSANQVGLSLRDTGAALDLMTARGMPAQVAATRLRMTLTLMAAPTEKASDAFKRIGLDSDSLAKKMQQPNGLVKAIELLKAHMGDLSKIEQTQLLSEAFGGARSGTTMMALVQNVGDLKERYDQIGKSAGNFNRQLRETNAEPLERLNQGFNTMKVALIKVGDALIPIVVPALEDFANVVGDAADAFTELDPGMQKILVFGALGAAALGPLLKVLGMLVSGYGSVMAGAERLDLMLASQASSTTAATAATTAYTESMIAAAAAQKELLIANASGKVTGSVPIGGAATVPGPGRFSKLLNRGAGAIAGGIGAQMVGGMVGGKGGNLISKVGTGAAAGSMFGLPGAAVGAAVGAVVADVELLTGAEKKLAPMQIKLAASSKEIVNWMAKQHQASAGLADAERNVSGAKAHHKETTQAVKRAEDKLADARRQFGPASKPAVRAEYDLARARNDNAKATKRVQNAERLKGNALQMYKAVTRSTMAEERHRIHLLGEQSQHLQDLFHKEQQAGASNQRLASIGKRGLKVIHELKDEQGSYAKTVGDATAKAGAKWTKHMKELPTAMLAFSKEINPFATKLEKLGNNPGPKKLAAAFADMDKRMQPIMDRTAKQLKVAKERTADYEKQTQLLPRSTVRSWGDLGDAMLRNTKKGQGGIEKVTTAQNKMASAAKRELPQATGSFKDFSTESNEALGQLGGSFNAFLEAFKQKPVDFTVTAGGGKEAAERKAVGGFVRAPDRRDSVHAILGGDEAVANVHQQPYIQIGLAASKAMGMQPFGSLGELFAGVQTPNHFAAGGYASKVPREVMHGKGALVPAGQKGLDMARHAGLEYVAKHAGGDRSLQALVRNANAIDSRHFPYRWGGGHQSSPAPWMVPYDCSGLISALVQHSGWKDIPTMVSGGFAQVGEPGPGKFSILANAEHVYSVIGGRAFGTSGENPGGGAGWISGYTFRPGFTVRHLPVLGEGGVGQAKAPKSGKKGPGQKLAKGLAKGGFAGGGRGALAPSMLRGLAKGGFAGTSPQAFAKGGMTVKGKVSYFGGGATAGGKDTSQPGLALNLHPGTEAGWNNDTTQGWMDQSKAGHPVIGATTIAGHHANLPIIDLGPAASTGRAIDVTEGGLSELGFSSSDFPTDAIGTVKVGTAAAAKEEDVPATFHGVRTDSPDFGSVPKNLHGVKREIKKREAEMDRYHKAVKAAKDKPKLERALLGCITALRSRLKQLRRAASLLRRKAAQRKVTRALAKKLKKITGAERDMEAAQGVYERMAQTAEQIVALEPQQPILPSNATEEQQAAAEKGYVGQLNDYIANQEKPAYAGLLGQLGNWREKVLGGESIAGNLETKWEAEVRSLEHEIDSINKLTGSHSSKWWHKHPDAFKKMKEQRARLPMLRFREREVRSALGEGRTAFYPGRKDPITPPAVPVAGTGSMEDMLVTIQGLHWPDFHSKINPLPLEPIAGSFGGYIFDTQLAIRDLDLKIDQNTASVAGAGTSSEANTELKDQLAEAIAEQNRIAARKQGIETSLGGVLAGFQSEFGRNLPYVGAFADGGIVPGRIGAPGLAVVHGGEAITPVGGGGDTHIYLAGDLARAIEASAPSMAKTSDKMIGRQTRKLSFAPGR